MEGPSMMRQRHSYHRLWYHLVFHTKNRERLLHGQEDVALLFGLMKRKAHDLDIYIESFGGWREHVHVLFRAGPTLPLCEIYRQLKGYSAAEWNRLDPDRPFKWGDGAYSITVDPDRCDDLRRYIHQQWYRHDDGDTVAALEREQDPVPSSWPRISDPRR
jgi:putative transposase